MTLSSCFYTCTVVPSFLLMKGISFFPFWNFESRINYVLLLRIPQKENQEGDSSGFKVTQRSVYLSRKAGWSDTRKRCFIAPNTYWIYQRMYIRCVFKLVTSLLLYIQGWMRVVWYWRKGLERADRSLRSPRNISTTYYHRHVKKKKIRRFIELIYRDK